MLTSRIDLFDYPNGDLEVDRIEKLLLYLEVLRGVLIIALASVDGFWSNS